MKKIIIIIMLCGSFVQAQLQVGSTILEEREVVNGLDVPWEIKWGPDNFIWVTERPGIVSRINVETGDKHVILDIQSSVWDSNEAGLLGMEIHPEFNNGAPYVLWDKTNNDLLLSDDTSIILGYSGDLELKGGGTESLIRDKLIIIET